MRAFWPRIALGALALALMLTGCATGYDYSNYRAHFPRSIVVLPPLNETTDVNASYSYLSTVTFPLAEMGYYIFPVAVVDHFFKENGMPTPGEMHQAPPKKIYEIMGADAVLYIRLKQYGSKFQLISSTTTVEAECRLVDTRTELLLWEGKLMAQEGSGGGPIGAVLGQLLNQATDHVHDVAVSANGYYMIEGRGLLYGPLSPKYQNP